MCSRQRDTPLASAMKVDLLQIFALTKKQLKRFSSRSLLPGIRLVKIVFSLSIRLRASFTRTESTLSRRAISEHSQAIRWLNSGTDGLNSILRLSRLKMGWRKMTGKDGKL